MLACKKKKKKNATGKIGNVLNVVLIQADILRCMFSVTQGKT